MLKRILRISILILMIFLSFFKDQSFAQNYDFTAYVPQSPKSPNAASLGQYGDIPVSLYTGVPNIQIPIYNITVGKLTIPISLSYHASGIKVEDYPSWVGTGWALNTGGVINRQRRGAFDETMIDGYSSFSSYVATILSGGSSSKDAATQMGINGYDTESDIFTYSYPSGAGKFYIEPTGGIYTMAANKIKISQTGRYIPPNGPKGFFATWTVTDNQGIQYVYNDKEVIENYTAASPPPFVNTWYLSEIILPNGQTINYTYTSYSYTIPNNPQYTSYFEVGTSYQSPISSTIYQNALRLSTITYPGGKVVFVPGTYRADLPKDQVLDHIDIYNQINSTYSLLKTYEIYTNNPPNIQPAELQDNTGTFRLNLDSMVMLDNAQKRIGAYSMTYNQTSQQQVPRNGSQDFWGYYNGKGASNRMPTIYETGPNGGVVVYGNGSGDRSVDTSLVKFDILQSISYPTGGKTSFTFESNIGLINDPNLSSVFLSPTSSPINHQVLYSLRNTTSGSAVGYSPQFTVGNVPGVISFQFSSSISNTDATNCTDVVQPCSTCGSTTIYVNPCYQVNLLKKNSDGSFSAVYTNIPHPYNTVFTKNTTYEFQIVFTGQAQDVVTMEATWQEAPDTLSNLSTTPFPAGGLRIKNIQSYDPVTNNTLTKTYSYLTDANTTSGIVAALPVYIYFVPSDIINGALVSNLHTVSNLNQSPTFNSSGSGISYSCVTEETDANGTLGKTVYKYTSNDTSQPGGYPDIGVIASCTFPFPPATSYEWRRGNLLSKYSYVNSNGSYKLVSKIDNTYNFSNSSDINYRVSSNIKTASFPVYGYNAGQWVNAGGYYLPYIYTTATEAFYTGSTATQTFDNQLYQVGVINEEDNVLDPVSLENSTTTVSQSNGNINTSQFQYALDYTNASVATDNASLGIKNLIALNLVNTPIEQLKIVKNPSGQSFVTGGTLLVYYKDKPKVNTYYKLDVVAPIALSSFVISSINSSGQFVFDSRYELISSIDTYTPGYNVSQVTKNAASVSAYQWGYNEQYPVAMASNAKSNDIFYDSFEEGDGNISTFKTGHYGFNGSYSHTLNNLDPGNYIVSYWLNNSGTWVFQSSTVSCGTSYTISLNGLVDDVRFYPVGAQMTTYTYDPLIGMTSTTDAKGEITYYEYDSLQRLMNIKDKDGNIIKHTDYHFQGQ